jgi:hypothetical protein
MPDLRVIDGGREIADAAPASFDIHDEFDDVEFGAPPNVFVGLATGLVGALAGFISLLIYFHIWDPAPYVSPQWLVFACLGAVAGYFMRMEKSLPPQLFVADD